VIRVAAGGRTLRRRVRVRPELAGRAFANGHQEHASSAGHVTDGGRHTGFVFYGSAEDAVQALPAFLRRYGDVDVLNGHGFCIALHLLRSKPLPSDWAGRLFLVRKIPARLTNAQLRERVQRAAGRVTSAFQLINEKGVSVTRAVVLFAANTDWIGGQEVDELLLEPFQGRGVAPAAPVANAPPRLPQNASPRLVMRELVKANFPDGPDRKRYDDMINSMSVRRTGELVSRVPAGDWTSLLEVLREELRQSEEQGRGGS